MINRAADPRTEDRIVYELLRTTADAAKPRVIGTATFRRGTSVVEAEEAVSVAVRELLERPFVDRVESDERPRGYRRTGRSGVDFLVPGMAEHFIARLRGLWLSYPDGSIVTAREAAPISAPPSASFDVPEAVEAMPSVTDPATRRATLAAREASASARPLVLAHPPLDGTRPTGEPMAVRRTDCGWIV